MSQHIQEKYIATAFLSCSLREEDRPFVEFIEQILKLHYIRPMGTVGYYSLAPINLTTHIMNNISVADFVVVVLTQRYFQKDVKSGKISSGISEMLHVESGMACMSKKPIIAFVQEGTDVGSFLPTITNYITLNREKSDLESKWKQINSLIDNTCKIVTKNQDEAIRKLLRKALIAGLAFVGGVSVLNFITSENKTEENRK